MSVRVQWLSAFPTRWKRFPSKRLFPESKNRAGLDDEQLTASQDYGVIPQKDFIRRAGRSVVQIHQHLDKRKRVEIDDFVISMRSFQGGLERAWSSGGIRSSYVVIKPSSEVDVGYFSRLFKSSDYIQALQATAHFIRDGQDLNYQNFRLVDLPLPPMEEQKQIAAFLDYETAKIDALIEQQQQLIALLGEKRQAVISHAVTKGLNPDAPMRDSGVKWLGEVPEHWGVVAFRHLVKRVVVGIAEAATHAYAEEGVSIVRSTNIKTGMIDRSSMLYIKPGFAATLESKALLAGDIVTTRTGANVGVSAVVPVSLHLSQCFTLVISTPNEQSNGEFYRHFINSEAGRCYIDLTAWGSGQPNISVSIIKEMHTVAPPRSEQDKIVEYVEEASQRFGILISKVENAVQLLQERRTALISAAVTGKIDVRGWKPPSLGAKNETKMEVA